MSGPVDLLGTVYCPACEDSPIRRAELMCRSCEAKVPGKARKAQKAAWSAYERVTTRANQDAYQASNRAAVEAVRAKLGKL